MKRALAITVLVLAVAFAGAPFVTSPFSGFEADQLPIPQIDPPVQPAGWAFSIWGLIYAWLIVSAAYGLWKRAEDEAWTRARWPLAISLAVGVPWLAIANASAIWATVTIFVMAVFAIAATARSPRTEPWLFRYPAGLYAGWLTAASCVSLATTLAGYGILFGPVIWAVLAICLALAVALLVLLGSRAGSAYGLAVVWALVGIVAANGTDQIFVAGLALAGALLVALVTWRLPHVRLPKPV